MTDKADEQPIADAVGALLGALLTPASAAAYEYDNLPDSLPGRYVEWTLSRRFGGSVRASGAIGTVSWRLTTRAVARSSEGVRALRTALAGLEQQIITVGAYSSTPVQFETTDDIEPDKAGYLSGISSWTLTL